jgi:uncharacterized protein
MNNNIKQSLIFAAMVIGLSYLVFWGPIVFLNLRTANLVEGKIYNPVAFIVFVLGGFVPSILGIVLTLIYEGKKGLKALLASAINIKIGYPSLVIIIGYVLLLSILQIALYTFLGGKFDYSQFLKQLPTIFPLIILGPLSEEFGWRGFLQKRLSKEYSVIWASIIIGIVWSMWHLPLFYMSGTSQHEFSIPFIPFLVSVTSSAFIYSYVYAKSKESLFSAILLHWIGTYVMQVIASQVVRTALYNSLECVPGLLLACVFIVIMSRNKSNNSLQSSSSLTI